MIRIVIDASVLVRAVKPEEAGGSECARLFQVLHRKVRAGDVELYEPPEFLLEVAANLHRQRRNVDSSTLNFLSLENPLTFRDFPFVTEKDVTGFIRFLQEKYGNKAFETKAADIIYLLVAHRMSATLVTADDGLLKYADHFKVISPAQFLDLIEK